MAMASVELAFRAWGDPELPVVLLVHGVTGCGNLWEPMARQLSDRFYLVAPDLRGHGRSPRPGSYRADDYLDDIEAFVAKRQLTAFALVGHSLGGLLCAAYTLRHPETVWGLVSIDINIPLPDWQIDRLHQAGNKAHNIFASREAALAYLRQRVTPSASDEHLQLVADSLLTTDGAGLKLNFERDVLRQFAPPGIANQLAGIRCPTLFLRGGDSPVMDRASGITALQQIRQARLVQIPRTGHHVFLDNPRTTAREIGMFLAEVLRRIQMGQPEETVLEKL
jgi:pimeloyl-ACP methyl ester carboxylesterase